MIASYSNELNRFLGFHYSQQKLQPDQMLKKHEEEGTL